MTSWIDVLVIAFTAQLLALPGEKGQFVIAGLATKYRPVIVVAGAACAFAGWTVLEIALGRALQGALPETYLDIATAVLFVLFAGMLLYSIPETDAPMITDGGLLTDIDVAGDGRAAGFVPSFSVMALGEFGDKTQLITIGLAAQYAAGSAIWAGEMLAIVPVSMVNAYCFHRFAHALEEYNVKRYLYLLSAVVFLAFAADITADLTFGVSVLPL
ncbi:TMEM165/GDT1 family protein [Halostella sp. PRR32]|uniref:TMEM165/GDT1 family protein n=1 Tax=Halostella sp. PRR32 TaxID=3098147 RepID=UPI002B1D01BF|nr:TMEM165/GDT1 family protein [Halostella sp. PRR32]